MLAVSIRRSAGAGLSLVAIDGCWLVVVDEAEAAVAEGFDPPATLVYGAVMAAAIRRVTCAANAEEIRCNSTNCSASAIPSCSLGCFSASAASPVFSSAKEST